MEVQQLLPVLLVQPLCSNNFHWFLWWHLTHEIISLMYFSISIVPFTMRRTPYITLERSNHLRDLWDKLRIPLLQLRILMAIWCLWHLQHLWSRCDTCGQDATLKTLVMATLATLSEWVILRCNNPHTKYCSWEVDSKSFEFPWNWVVWNSFQLVPNSFYCTWSCS